MQLRNQPRLKHFHICRVHHCLSEKHGPISDLLKMLLNIDIKWMLVKFVISRSFLALQTKNLGTLAEVNCSSRKKRSALNDLMESAVRDSCK
jgi:hypothetical protein